MKLSNVVKLNEILGTKALKVLDIKLAYKIVKLVRRIEDDVNFYRDNWQKILNETVTKDSDGMPKIENGNYVFTFEKREEFNKRISELNGMEIEIPNEYKFKLDELSGLELSLADMYIIEPLIVE